MGMFLGRMNVEYAAWRLSKAEAYLCCLGGGAGGEGTMSLLMISLTEERGVPSASMSQA